MLIVSDIVADPDLHGSALVLVGWIQEGKNDPQMEKSAEISCFELLDVLLWGLVSLLDLTVPIDGYTIFLNLLRNLGHSKPGIFPLNKHTSSFCG